jgi:hypothetical protein
VEQGALQVMKVAEKKLHQVRHAPQCALSKCMLRKCVMPDTRNGPSALEQHLHGHSSQAPTCNAVLLLVGSSKLKVLSRPDTTVPAA